MSPTTVDPEIFKAYDVRGIYGEQIDEDVAYRIGRGFARVLADMYDCEPGGLRLALGRDMRLSAPALSERYARVAQGLGVDVHGRAPLEAALLGVEEIYRLTDDLEIPTLEELGFSEEEIPLLARIAFEDPQTIGNPREVDAAGYEQIYRNAFARGSR
jgi:choline dehydrogenase